MNLTRKAIYSILIQSIGSSSQLLLTLILTNNGGVSYQGAFAEYKSFFDLLVTIGCFGLPQSLLISQHIKKARSDTASLYWFSIIYATFVLVIYLLVFLIYNYTLAIHSKSLSAIFYLSLGVYFLIIREIWRGLYIEIDDGISYSLFTIIPSLSIFLFISIYSFIDVEFEKNISYYLLTSSLLSIVLSIALFKQPYSTIKKIKYKEIFSRGLDSFIQALAFNLQIFLIYQLILMFGGKKEDVGIFSSMLIVYQLSVLPIQFLAPMLIKKWMLVESKTLKYRNFEVWLIRIFFIYVTFAFLIISVVLKLENFYLLVSNCQLEMIILAISIIPSAISRAYAIVFLANDFIYSNSITALIRLFATTITFYAFYWISQNPLFLASISWLFGEVSMLLYSIYYMSRKDT